MKLKQVVIASTLIIACEGVENKKNSRPFPWETEGKKFELAYNSWNPSKYQNYSYSYVDTEDNRTKMVQVDVVDGQVVCRRLIENNQIIWSEMSTDINSHLTEPLGITLDGVYQRCYKMYQIDKRNIAFFYQRDVLVGCNRNCSNDNSCRPDDVPFFNLIFDRFMCAEV